MSGSGEHSFGGSLGASAQCTKMLLGNEKAIRRAKENLVGLRRRHSDAVVEGIMVLGNSANRKIRD